MPDQMPWEKYGSPDASQPPWEKYGAPAQEPTPAPAQPTSFLHDTLGFPRTLKEFVTSPNGLIRTGARQIGQGGKELVTPGQRQNGVSDLIEGGGRMLTPAALPFAAAAPIAAGAAAGAGYLGQKAGELVTRKLGGSPETERMVGDITSLPAGAVGGKAGGLVQRAAAPLAESALGIRGDTHAYGATPGKAILEETNGVRPSTIAESAQRRIGDLNTELEGRAASAPPASLVPARNVLQNKISSAAAANSELTPREVSPMLSQLTEARPGFKGLVDPNNPGTIAADQPASDFLKMKRQFGDDFANNWNPALSKGTIGTGRQAYGAMAKELNRVIPGGEGLNQRMSSLIPAAERARLTDLTAGPGERIMNRVARPTGGLVAPIAAFRMGGIPALLTEMVGQEMMSSPTAKMIGARTMNGVGKPLSNIPASVIGSAKRHD